MVLQPGATSSLDLEKRDRKMAKVIIDIVGLEPEKYRLGYTKVTDGRTVGAIASKQNRLTPTPRERERGALFIALFRWLLFFSFFWRPFPCPPFDTWPFSLLLSPLIFSLGVFPRRRSRNDGGDSRGENCQDTQLDASRGQRQDGQGRIQEAPATKGMYRIR